MTDETFLSDPPAWRTWFDKHGTKTGQRALDRAIREALAASPTVDERALADTLIPLIVRSASLDPVAVAVTLADPERAGPELADLERPTDALDMAMMADEQVRQFFFWLWAATLALSRIVDARTTTERAENPASGLLGPWGGDFPDADPVRLAALRRQAQKRR